MASNGIVIEEDGFIDDLLNPGQTLHVNAVVPPVTTSAKPPVVTSSGGLSAPPITTTAGASSHVPPGQSPWLLPGWSGQAPFPGGQAFPGGPASIPGGQGILQPTMSLPGY